MKFWIFFNLRSLSVVGIFWILIFLPGCHKQVGGPRKITAVGHVEYSFATGILTKVFYENDPTKKFTIRINRDYTISGDAVGTWAESGAQILMYIDGDFGPNSPLPVDYGYYRDQDFIAIEGQEVNMREFAEKTYFIAVTHGFIGGNEYYRQFVFE